MTATPANPSLPDPSILVPVPDLRSAAPSGLPLPLTPLIGRDRESLEAEAAMEQTVGRV